MMIAQITDMHIRPRGRIAYGQVDTNAMLEPPWRRDATELGQRHGLTFYDAAFAAAARGLDVPLVSADRQLLASGLALSLTAWASACYC